jgi:D-sedoheptulose 7-phosphate isomerase
MNTISIAKVIEDSILVKQKILANPILLRQIDAVVNLALEKIQGGGKIIFAGNGGSFADAQHLAAEFTSRFMFDRAPLPAIALGTNNSAMSAIGNDYGYENIFVREVLSLAHVSDLFIPISTSGNSKNLLIATETAISLGIEVVGLTGEDGGQLANLCSCIKVPSNITARIQESHILIGHIFCELVESLFFNKG